MTTDAEYLAQWTGMFKALVAKEKPDLVDMFEIDVVRDERGCLFPNLKHTFPVNSSNGEVEMLTGLWVRFLKRHPY